jgi:hypothetical protein
MVPDFLSFEKDLALRQAKRLESICFLNLCKISCIAASKKTSDYASSKRSEELVSNTASKIDDTSWPHLNTLLPLWQ